MTDTTPMEHPTHAVAHRRYRTTLCGVLLLAAVPALAQELAPLENLADFIVAFMTGAFARSIAIIAVAVLGFMGLTGRLRWGIAGSVIGGIALIFGAATIVDAVSGSL